MVTSVRIIIKKESPILWKPLTKDWLIWMLILIDMASLEIQLSKNDEMLAKVLTKALNYQKLNGMIYLLETTLT